MITIDSLLDLVKSETYQKQVISPVALPFENDNEECYHPTYKEHLGHFHWINRISISARILSREVKKVLTW